ncbi:MAG: FtsW/RodA/SpoVE family cell cycle protein [Lachnospiraceae bacterium]|nr:FtsW/RodA/SpoVE family cell cycle protein [Lachnospiraceae bacterium]
MTSVFIQTAKYLMIALIVTYTVQSFLIFLRHHSEQAKRILFKEQMVLIYLFLSLGFLSMTAYTGEQQILLLFAFTLAVITLLQLVYRLVYVHGSILLCNHMCILFGTGILILTRLNQQQALRQLIIGAVSIGFTAFFPYLMSKKQDTFRKWKWVYLIVSATLLLLVLIAGQTSYGAKISVAIGGISIQPVELVKLLYVFFLAAMYYEKQTVVTALFTGGCTAAFLLILAAARDLGAALIFFVIYVGMTYAVYRKWVLLPAAAGVVLLAMIGAGKSLGHVSNRIIAWKDPLSAIDDQGYQISQSLFGIGTGSWMGSGLFMGRPKSIPVVSKDFIFSAISEELGAIVAIAVILISMLTLLLFFRMARAMQDPFYRWVSLGMGICYGFQVFLTIGGCIKLIPSTGVTFPLVSYGGSSLFVTFCMFALLESFYITTKKKDSR